MAAFNKTASLGWNRTRDLAQQVVSNPGSAQTSRQRLMAQQTVQTPKWYRGNQPTRGEVMARIASIGRQDEARGAELWEQFNVFSNDPTSPIYSPYSRPTSTASTELKNFGIDTASSTWMQDYAWLKDKYRVGVNGTPLAPSSKSSDEENAAYWYYKAVAAEEDTVRAENEWAALQEEIGYWVNRSDRNYSDDEVLGKIDWSNYPTLKAMDTAAAKGTPYQLNRSIGYSTDGMYGAIWAARNSDQSGDTDMNSVRYYLGQGSGWKENADISAQLDPANARYNPYAVGSTCDAEALYFGVNSFDPDWLSQNQQYRGSADATAQRMYSKVYDAEQRTLTAESELAQLRDNIDTMLEYTSDPSVVLHGLRDKYPTLKKMDESLKSGDILAMTRAVPYRWADIEQEVQDRCAEMNSAQSAEDYTQQLTEKLRHPRAAVDSQAAINSARGETINSAGGVIAKVGTDSEKRAFKVAYAPDFDRYLTQMTDAITQGTAEPESDHQQVQEHARTFANEHYMGALTKIRPYEAMMAQRDEAQAELDQLEQVFPYLVDAEDTQSVPTLEQAQAQERMKILRHAITAANGELASMQPEYEAAVEEAALVEKGYNVAERYAALAELPPATDYTDLQLMDFAYNFGAEYKPTDWQAYSLYDMALREGHSREEVSEAAAQGREQNLKLAEQIDQIIFQAEDRGIWIDTDTELNMVRERDRLLRDAKAAEYFMLADAEDFDAVVAETKQKVSDAWGGFVFLPSLFGAGGYSQMSYYAVNPEASINMGSGRVDGYMMQATQEERDTYLYLLGTQGEAAAQEYYNHLADATYGVLPTRTAENATQFWGDFAAEHEVTATALSVIASPFQMAGTLYAAFSGLTGQEINPNHSTFGASSMVSATRGTVKSEINEALGEDTVGAQIANFAYDVVTGIGDTAMNIALTGGVGTGASAASATTKAGKFTMKLAESFAQAAPMGLSAAGSTIQNAKQNGAEDWQALALGGASFIAETATEAVSVGNISEAFNNGAKTTKKFLSTLAMDMFEEGAGEGLSEALSTVSDDLIMGELSQRNQLIDQYMSEGLSKEEAEKRANADTLTNILYSGAVGAVSGGVTTTVSTTAGQVATNLQAKAEKRERVRQTGHRLVALTSAVDSHDESNITTAIAATLAPSEATPQEQIVVSAAAQHLSDELGGEQAADLIRDTLLTAAEADISSDDVSMAITVATLGKGQAKQALGALRADVTPEALNGLMSAAQTDMQNSMVQENVKKATAEAQIAMRVKELAADGALAGLASYQTGVTQAQTVLQTARENLSTAQQDYLSAGQNLRTVQEQFNSDPANPAFMGAYQQAIKDVEGRAIVAAQYEQSVQNAEQKLQEAETTLKQQEELAMKNLREQAQQEILTEREATVQAQLEAEEQAMVEVEHVETPTVEPSLQTYRRKPAYAPPSIDMYTSQTYNQYGWARVNDVITPQTNARFKSLAADAKKESPQTQDGKYVVVVPDENDVGTTLIVTDARKNDPSIERVYKLNFESDTDAEKVRDDIREFERKHGAGALELVQNHYGERVVMGYTAASFGDYQRLRAAGRSQNAGGDGGEAAPSSGTRRFRRTGAADSDAVQSRSGAASGGQQRENLTDTNNNQSTQQTQQGASSMPEAKPKNSPQVIAKNLASTLHVGDYIGTRKMNGVPRDVLGYYETRANYIAVRNTEAGNYCTSMHEIGHALAHQLGLTGTQEMVDQLDPVFAASYPPDELAGEAFAEFVRKYMENEQTGRDFAGDAFVDAFQTELARKGLAKDVAQAATDLRTWIAASTDAKIASVIHPLSEAKKTPLREQFRKLIAGVVDATSAAEAVNHAIREQSGSTDVPLSVDVRSASLLKNTASKRAYNILTENLTDANWNIIGGGLAQALEQTGVTAENMDLLERYMLALHSLDRDKQHKPVFDDHITPEERQKFIDRVQREHPEVAQAEEAFQNWRREFITEFLVKPGYLTQSAFAQMEKLYPHYVPTRRVKDERYQAPKSSKQYQVRRATGSTEDIWSPLDTFVTMVDSIVTMVSANNAALTWERAAQQYALSEFGREITPDSKLVTVNTEQLQEQIADRLTGELDEDLLGEVLDLIGTRQQQWVTTRNSSIPNTLVIQHPNGRVTLWEIADTELYKLLASITEKSGNSALRICGKLTRGMSALTTGSNPVFAFRNAARDFQNSVNYGSWANSYVDGFAKWVKAAYKVWTEDGEFKDYKALGGGGWNRIDAGTKKGAAQYRAALFKGYNTSNIGRTAKFAGQKLWETVTMARVNEVVEQASRFAEYLYGQHDLSTTEGKQSAFLAAQDVTTDFSRSGNGMLVDLLKQVVPFFNASVQGVYRTGRLFSEAERNHLPKVFTKTLVNTGIVSAITAGILLKTLDEDEKEEFAQMSDELKAQHIYLPNFAPKVFGQQPFIRIPLAQDPLTYAVHGAVTNAVWNGSSEDSVIGFTALAETILDSINPLGSGTIFQPLIGVGKNQNWYGGRIVPTRMVGGDRTLQYTDDTPQLFIDLGRVFDTSPLALQYLAEQYTGFLGQLVIPALSPNEHTGELGGVRAAIAAAQKRFTSDPLISQDVVNSFYDNAALLGTISSAARDNKPMNMLRRGLSPEEAGAAYEEAKALTSSNGIVGQTKTRISELYDEIDSVNANQTLTDEQKYQLTSELRREMIQQTLLAQEAMGEYKEKYITGDNLLTRRLTAGTVAHIPTAYDKLPDVFKADADKQYMVAAQEVWDATGKDSVLPHPLTGFDDNRIHYEVPSEYVDRYNTVYQLAYQEYFYMNSAKWSILSVDERADLLVAAHQKAHSASKDWYLKEIGVRKR